MGRQHKSPMDEGVKGIRNLGVRGMTGDRKR